MRVVPKERVNPAMSRTGEHPMKTVIMGVASVTIIVVGLLILRGSISADLSVTVVASSPMTVKLGDGLVIPIRVLNHGSDSVTPYAYTLKLQINGTEVYSGVNGNPTKIKPGLFVDYGRVPGSFDWEPSSAGGFPFVVTLEPNFWITDPNVTDNVFSGVIIVTEK
jgi:hypothetical protein